MGPSPGLGTHAHNTIDGPQTRAQHRGRRERGPLTTKSQHPQHPTVQRPGGLGKQDSP